MTHVTLVLTKNATLGYFHMPAPGLEPPTKNRDFAPICDCSCWESVLS